MRAAGTEIAAQVGPECLLIEYGSGSSQKTRILLDSLERPAGYVPIDISREQLRESAAAVANAYPGLRVLPVCAAYTATLQFPPHLPNSQRPLPYHPPPPPS